MIHLTTWVNNLRLVFKPGIADETTKESCKPADEFYAVEAEPRGVRTGPDDYEIEFWRKFS